MVYSLHVKSPKKQSSRWSISSFAQVEKKPGHGPRQQHQRGFVPKEALAAEGSPAQTVTLFGLGGEEDFFPQDLCFLYKYHKIAYDSA